MQISINKNLFFFLIALDYVAMWILDRRLATSVAIRPGYRCDKQQEGENKPPSKTSTSAVLHTKLNLKLNAGETPVSERDA